MSKSFTRDMGKRSADCPSELLLTRFVTGELDSARQSTLHQHVNQCASCAPRLWALQQAQAEFRKRFSTPSLVADLQARLARADASVLTLELKGMEAQPEDQPSETAGIESNSSQALAHEPSPASSLHRLDRPGNTRFSPREGLLTRLRRQISDTLEPIFASLTPGSRGFALAALLLLSVVSMRLAPLLFTQGHQRDLTSEYVGEKSAQRAPGPMEVFMLRNGKTTAAASGDSFFAGDRLQFLVRPGSYPWLFLVSVDASGRLSAYVPDSETESMRLSADGEQMLPHAIELDQYRGKERIFAVFSEVPVTFEQLQASVKSLPPTRPLALESLERLPVAGTAQASFLVVKP